MSDLTARGAAQMSDELVNTLENLGLFFGGATGRLTRDYGELSGHNFQMMAMHTDPEKLAKDLASLAEAAARIRLLEQQLSTAREAFQRIEDAGFGGYLTPELVAEITTEAIRSLGEPSAHPPGE